MSGEGLNYQIEHLEKKIKIIYQFDKKKRFIYSYWKKYHYSSTVHVYYYTIYKLVAKKGRKKKIIKYIGSWTQLKMIDIYNIFK